MKEKILAALVAISGQYNLPKEQLEKIAGFAPNDLTEDKISSWAELQKPYMALMQTYSDSRVTSQSKELNALKSEFEAYKKEHGASSTQTTDLEKALGAMKAELEASFVDKMKGYSDLQGKYEELLKKQEESDAHKKNADFVELKKRVARELGLSDVALGLVEGKLDAGMDESKVNEVLSQCKKDLQSMGIHTVESGQISKSATDAAEARAKAYLDNLEKQQKANN